MKRKSAEEHAAAVIEAFDRGRLIELLTSDDPTLDEDRAYEIAFAICERRATRGESMVGRKIGFTNRTIWPQYGVWAPIWGHVYDSTTTHSEHGFARLAIDHLIQPRVEPEVQLHFAHTPPVTRDEEAILSAIDWIALGFEIVQCPFADWRFEAADAIAAYGVHGALIVGMPVQVVDVEDCANKLRTFTVTLSRNGVPAARGGGANVLGSPVSAAAHLAEVLAQQSQDRPIQAGEIVTTGTLTDLQPAVAGDTWETLVEGIELPGLRLALA